MNKYVNNLLRICIMEFFNMMFLHLHMFCLYLKTKNKNYIKNNKCNINNTKKKMLYN